MSEIHGWISAAAAATTRRLTPSSALGITDLKPGFDAATRGARRTHTAVITRCIAGILLAQTFVLPSANAQVPADASPVAVANLKANQPSPRLLVVLIGGMDSDPTPAQIEGRAGRGGNSGLYRLMGDLQHAAINTEYFNWNGTRAGKIKSRTTSSTDEIELSIRSHVRAYPRSRVILVGNSWGGHTTWNVCQKLTTSDHPVAIDLAVFLDPSSAGRAQSVRPKNLPVNINRAINIYTHNVFGWQKWPKESRIENIDLGDPENGFLRTGGPAYDAPFNFNAHIAAEWDEQIHAAIKSNILQFLPPNSPRTAIP